MPNQEWSSPFRDVLMVIGESIFHQIYTLWILKNELKYIYFREILDVAEYSQCWGSQHTICRLQKAWKILWKWSLEIEEINWNKTYSMLAERGFMGPDMISWQTAKERRKTYALHKHLILDWWVEIELWIHLYWRLISKELEKALRKKGEKYS